MEKVARLAPLYKEATKEGMWEWGRQVIAEAQSLAPVEEGDLIGSGFTDDAVEIGDTLSLELGFTAEYALVQHERMDFFHPRGGQAKYLEQPLIMRSTQLFDVIAEFIDAAMEARL